ncbi:hypothetical protein [Spirillospora sp. CA-128828]|uniref:hypothetical protein n=1 Tax=Spirillospora sp. CA-128828 TaxID=3240033 RepID=UPI003D93F3D9
MDGLFDLPHVKQPPEATETPSPDQKRTRRQRDMLAAGYHPLTLVMSRPLRLHDDAAPADDSKADGARCGGCRFRELKHYGPRSWPKCTIGGRESHGGGTDVRKWWPACTDFQPKADGQ